MAKTGGPYARANLFVGKYEKTENGHIKLGARARVRLMKGKETEEGWRQEAEGDWWLIVEDDAFWPVMVKLEEGDDVMKALRGLKRA